MDVRTPAMTSSLDIKLPRRVSAGMNVTAEWANSIRESIDRVANIAGPSARARGGLPPYPMAWKLEVRMSGGSAKWSVSSDNSSITDGTNGTAVDITTSAGAADGLDYETTYTTDSYILLEMDVAYADLTISGFSVIAVDGTDTTADEVEFAAGLVDKVRLLVGKVSFGDHGPECVQACDYPVICTTGILNGAAVRVFERHPLHMDAL